MEDIMFTVENHAINTADGVLVIGDTHGDFKSFLRARDYALGENFLLASLGDLTDRGREPYETVESMYRMMYDGRAIFTIGNHDDKHHRAATGKKVSLSRDTTQTLDDVGPDRLHEFRRMYSAIVTDTMLSAMYHKFGDYTLVHGASHPCLWEDSVKIGKSARSRFLYGETISELDAEGYPTRLYNWVNEVPMGKTVIVGHDKQPIHGVPITEPMVVSNPSGGKVIFLDTGCGKGGFLSGAVLMYHKKKFVLDKFMEFKDEL